MLALLSLRPSLVVVNLKKKKINVLSGKLIFKTDSILTFFTLKNLSYQVQKQDDQHEHTFSNYMRIQIVDQKTCLRR